MTSSKTIAAAQLIADIRELKKHRAIAYLGEAEILNMLRGAGSITDSDYTLLSVYAEPMRCAIALVLAHPSFALTPEGAQPPEVRAPVWGRDLRLVDHNLYQRSVLTLDVPLRNPLRGTVSDDEYDAAYQHEPVVRELAGLVIAMARRLYELGEEVVA